MKPKKISILVVMASLALLLGACGTSRLHVSNSVAVDKSATWAVLPFDNHTTVPFAGQQAQTLAAALLQSHGVSHVDLPPPPANPAPIGEDAQQRQQQQEWARSQQVRYLVTGSVEEWRYKVGMDGEPAVSLTLVLTDVATGQPLWRGAASASGRYWQSVGVVAQNTLDRLVKRLISD